MGYASIDKGKFRMAYQAHTSVTAPRQLKD